MLQLLPERAHNFRLHCLNDTLDILLVIHVLRDERALKFHNCFDDQLELVSFRLFLALLDVVVFQNLSDDLMQFVERAGENRLDCWLSHDTNSL